MLQQHGFSRQPTEAADFSSKVDPTVGPVVADLTHHSWVVAPVSDQLSSPKMDRFPEWNRLSPMRVLERTTWETEGRKEILGLDPPGVVAAQHLVTAPSSAACRGTPSGRAISANG